VPIGNLTLKAQCHNPAAQSGRKRPSRQHEKPLTMNH
jgi:hypothetical protein